MLAVLWPHCIDNITLISLGGRTIFHYGLGRTANQGDLGCNNQGARVVYAKLGQPLSPRPWWSGTKWNTWLELVTWQDVQMVPAAWIVELPCLPSVSSRYLWFCEQSALLVPLIPFLAQLIQSCWFLLLAVKKTTTRYTPINFVEFNLYKGYVCVYVCVCVCVFLITTFWVC
jgi:hypothetical protein